MSKIYNFFNWRNLMVGRNLLYLALTLLLTITFYNIANTWLSNYLNAKNESIYTYNYSLGITGLILVIPAAIISIWATKFVLLLKKILLPPPVEEKLIKIAVIIAPIILTLFKWTWKAIVSVSIGIAYVFIFLISIFSSSYSTGGSSSGSYPSNDSKRRKAIEEADALVKRTESAKRHAIDYAGKQGRYNANTHHFDSRVNHANAKIREYEEAKKNRRNM